MLALLALTLVGCATSTVESRKKENLAAYGSLSADEKALVDGGQIKVGMGEQAVLIAWGKPSEVLASEDQSGRATTWLYYGTWMQQTRYWSYREVSRGGSPDLCLERYMDTDFNPRDYVRAEIVFRDGKVASWRTLPRPPS